MPNKRIQQKNDDHQRCEEDERGNPPDGPRFYGERGASTECHWGRQQADLPMNIEEVVHRRRKRWRDRKSEGKGPDHKAKNNDGKHMTRWHVFFDQCHQRQSSNDTTTSHVQHNAASCRPRTVPSPGGTATTHVRLSSKGEDCSLHERMAFHFPDFAEATFQRATPTGDITNGLAQSADDERRPAVIDPARLADQWSTQDSHECLTWGERFFTRWTRDNPAICYVSYSKSTTISCAEQTTPRRDPGSSGAVLGCAVQRRTISVSQAEIYWA